MQIHPQKEQHLPVVHFGIFRRRLSLWQAVGLIVSGTVGAGVLGIPYVVAQVGILPGVFYIIGLGLAVMGLNLLIGSVCIRTKAPMQLIGLARTYLGVPGEVWMGLIFYLSMFAVLLIYIIGVGETLQAMLGGTKFFWSSLFFLLATCLIILGIRTIKTVELVLTVAIIAVISIVSLVAIGYFNIDAFVHVNLLQAFLPYGVILFAFHAAFAIPEAHQLLVNKKDDFKKAICISSVITITLYIVFAIAVVGVTGIATTQIATIGLGEAIGPVMVLLGNIFAVFAMSTSYLLVGLSLKHSMSWDFNIPGWLSITIVSVIPFSLYILGVNQFIQAIGFVGGILISAEMILSILIYLRARKHAQLQKRAYKIHHALVLAMALFIICVLGAVSSIATIFK